MNAITRAKFKVESTTLTEHGSRIILKPVSSGSKENSEFFKWTPSGAIDIGTVNPAVAPQFTPGREFYVDFVAADQVPQQG